MLRGVTVQNQFFSARVSLQLNQALVIFEYNLMETVWIWIRSQAQNWLLVNASLGNKNWFWKGTSEIQHWSHCEYAEWVLRGLKDSALVNFEYNLIEEHWFYTVTPEPQSWFIFNTILLEKHCFWTVTEPQASLLFFKKSIEKYSIQRLRGVTVQNQ